MDTANETIREIRAGSKIDLDWAMPLTQFVVLATTRHLQTNEGIEPTVSDIVARSWGLFTNGLNPNSANNILKKCVSEGLVERTGGGKPGRGHNAHYCLTEHAEKDLVGARETFRKLADLISDGKPASIERMKKEGSESIKAHN